MATADPVLTKHLKDLNDKINDAENNGTVAFLQSILAPRLAFQRANQVKTVDDQVAFLQKVETGGKRMIDVLDPILVFHDRAFVECVVTMPDAKGVTKHYHNVRLFVLRDKESALSETI